MERGVFQEPGVRYLVSDGIIIGTVLSPSRLTAGGMTIGGVQRHHFRAGWIDLK